MQEGKLIRAMLLAAVAAATVGHSSAAGGQAQGQGQVQAIPCMAGSIALAGDALPRGVLAVSIPERPSAEIPFELATVLVNQGAEPLYIVSVAPYQYDAERDGSGVPKRFLPHYKLVSGEVHEWQQDASAPVATDANSGLPIYAWRWVPVSSGFAYRQTEKGDGLLLLPDAFGYIKTGAPRVDVFDCSEGIPEARLVRLSAFYSGKPVTIRGTLTYRRIGAS